MTDLDEMIRDCLGERAQTVTRARAGGPEPATVARGG